MADKHRTAQRHPRPSYTRRAPSKQRRQKRSASSTSYETSATSQSALSPPASPHSYNLFKACICGYKTSAATCKRSSMAISP